MSPSKAEDQLIGGNGNIFNNKEKISSVLKTAVKDKLAELDCLIGKFSLPRYNFLSYKKNIFFNRR